MTTPTDQSFQGSLRQIAAMSGRRKAALLGFGFLFLMIVVLIAIGQSLWLSDDLVDLDKPPVEQPASAPTIPWQPHP
jgi:hypothetical protein